MLWVDGILSEGLDFFHWYEWLDPLVWDDLNLLDGVRSPEAVKGVDTWVLSLDSGNVSDNSEVHCFLDVWRDQHREAGLSNSHDIAVVSMDGERMGGDRTGGNVEYNW